MENNSLKQQLEQYIQEQEIDLNGFPNWQKMAQEHWEEFLPKMYHEYQQAGILKYQLAIAAEMTFREMDALELSGMRPHEAWEMVREKHLLLLPEQQM